MGLGKPRTNIVCGQRDLNQEAKLKHFSMIKSKPLVGTSLKHRRPIA